MCGGRLLQTLSGTVRTKTFELSEERIMELEELGREVATERGSKVLSGDRSKYPQFMRR